MSNTIPKIMALSGGVGGAKLALGFSKILQPEQLTIVANTGDDFEHLGLTICPDLDTLMYTLADLYNKQQGWGLENETWSMLEALKRLDGLSWFQLGDQDVATHLYRSSKLREGTTLADVTKDLCSKLGIRFDILPMSNDQVRTKVCTDQGVLDFQEYFVREQCRPSVEDFFFEGVDVAKAQPRMLSLLGSNSLDAIVICPSNPFVSVAPIIELAGVRKAMALSAAPVIAISPIINGAAVKGPAAKMMTELGMPTNPLEIAKHYCSLHGDSLLDALVIDQADESYADAIAELGIEPLVTPIMMHDTDDKIRLAEYVLDHVRSINPMAEAS